MGSNEDLAVQPCQAIQIGAGRLGQQTGAVATRPRGGQAGQRATGIHYRPAGIAHERRHPGGKATAEAGHLGFRRLSTTPPRVADRPDGFAGRGRIGGAGGARSKANWPALRCPSASRAPDSRADHIPTNS
jgi:hypothetical protein